MTKTLPRLPRELMYAGFVAVPVRKDPGFLAHRVTRVYHGERTDGQFVYKGDREPVHVVPACLPDGERTRGRYHELSGPMADQMGARACTEPACFPHAADPAPDEPVSVPPGGPRADDTVWIATARREIEAHRIDAGLTGCGRSTRTGEQLPARDAWGRHEARWCRRCWPPAKP